MRRPEPSEYDEYYRLYVDQVPEGDVLETLSAGAAETAALLSEVGQEQETYRYEPGKWSIREVLGHVVDVERVFAYRALSIARADPAPLPGLDQHVWARGSNAGEQPLASLLEQLDLARRSNVALFRGFDETLWERRGVASGCEFSVRSLSYILAGHEIHHRRVLAERYLKPLRGAA